MALRDVLLPPPAVPSLAAAVDYHAHVLTLLSEPAWTRAERQHLHRLARRWRRRAINRDPRWTMHGDRAGRLPRALEAAIRGARRPQRRARRWPHARPVTRAWPVTDEE